VNHEEEMLHVIDDFLTPGACDELVACYDAAQTEQSRTVDGLRRSSHFVYVQHDEAALGPVWASIPPLFEQSACERAQITRYDVGGSFGVHSDAFTAEYQRKMGTRQRSGTFLVYLSDVDGGGETHFPRLEVRVKPRKGRALWFRPSKDGLIDYELIHAALPVTRGVKYVLQIWCRERGNLTEKK
jgi:prolyl 4-hydroxylase